MKKSKKQQKIFSSNQTQFLFILGNLRSSLKSLKLFTMQRRYTPRNRLPKKEFINSYHINQVPLPYYNPLSDPFLQGFFTNSKTNQHITKMGLLFSPQKQFPYEQRRLINFNKFHKNNYYDVPAANLYKNNSSFFRKQKARSMADFSKDADSTQCQMFKRASENDFAIKPQERSFFKEDLLSQRPNTNASSKRGSYSSQGKTRSHIFSRKEFKKRDFMSHSGQVF